MQVAIDTTKCQGHGRCALLVPDVFDIGDDGLGTVTQPNVPSAMEEDVARAVASCPESAIRIS